jgi:hypothetical protein
VSAAVTGADVLREAAFRVVRGDPTPDELAALVAVLTLSLHSRDSAGDGGGGGVLCATPARAEWDRPADGYRSPLAWAA